MSSSLFALAFSGFSLWLMVCFLLIHEPILIWPIAAIRVSPEVRSGKTGGQWHLTRSRKAVRLVELLVHRLDRTVPAKPRRCRASGAGRPSPGARPGADCELRVQR